LKVGGNCQDNVSTHLIQIYNIDTVVFAILKAEKIHIVALNPSTLSPGVASPSCDEFLFFCENKIRDFRQIITFTSSTISLNPNNQFLNETDAVSICEFN